MVRFWINLLKSQQLKAQKKITLSFNDNFDRDFTLITWRAFPAAAAAAAAAAATAAGLAKPGCCIPATEVNVGETSDDDEDEAEFMTAAAWAAAAAWTAAGVLALGRGEAEAAGISITVDNQI